MHDDPTAVWLPYAAVRGAAASSVAGDLRVLPDVPSAQLGLRRDILVHLPPDAFTSGRRYPVVYLHDGQNLFDATTSYAGDWHADETLATLATDDGLPLIAVGIPNGGERRFAEYTPFPGRPDRAWTGGRGSTYLRFLVDTVKPLVDAAFPTRTDRAATGILGSSLGGLISLWAAVQYGDTFGLIGAMSAGMPPGQGEVLDRLREARPKPIRAYLDLGLREISDAPNPTVARQWHDGFVRNLERTRDALVAAGLREPDTLRFVVDPEGIHNEASWARRLPDALRFLFGPTNADERG